MGMGGLDDEDGAQAEQENGDQELQAEADLGGLHASPVFDDIDETDYLKGLYLTSLEKVSDCECTGCLELNALSGVQDTVTFGIDSGAALTMMRKQECQQFRITPTAESSRGEECRAASGHHIRFEGGRRLMIAGDDGKPRILRTHVGNITKNLMAASDLVDSGHKIVLDDQDCYIEHKASGKITPIYRRHRVFEADFKLATPDLLGSPGSGPASQ